MPFSSAITQIRLNNIITCLNVAVSTVEIISKELGTPFLAPIVTTMWSLLSAVQVTLAHSRSTGTDQPRRDDQEEQGCVPENAGTNLPVALRNHPSDHNIQHWG
jgi:hypothetical protein